MLEFKMPTLGADMDEGTLLEWNVAVGDTVKKGDIVAVVDTTKGAIDIEIFADGVIEKLLVEPGTEVPVGSDLAHVRTNEAGSDIEPAKAVATSNDKPATATPTTAAAPTAKVESAAASPARTRGPRIRVSPRARRLAKQLHVDLATVQATGPGGAITAGDVEAAGKLVKQTEHPKAADPRQAMRNTISAAMSRSKREIPHYYLAHDVDVGALFSFLESWNENHPVAQRILPALLYYKAIGMAAAEFAAMNGSYTAGRFEPSPDVNLGIAISIREGGLIAPCLMDVPHKTAVDLMRELKQLVQRARKGGLRASEMSMGTLTVSNLGDRGVDFLAGVIYPPQVALVGIGSMRRQPWAVEDKVEVRPVIKLTLAADHRVSDGHTGALFLRRIEQLINSPEELM